MQHEPGAPRRFSSARSERVEGVFHMAVVVKTVLGSHFGGFSVHHPF